LTCERRNSLRCAKDVLFSEVHNRSKLPLEATLVAFDSLCRSSHASSSDDTIPSAKTHVPASVPPS
jgi:hypothetical protein